MTSQMKTNKSIAVTGASTIGVGSVPAPGRVDTVAQLEEEKTATRHQTSAALQRQRTSLDLGGGGRRILTEETSTYVPSWFRREQTDVDMNSHNNKRGVILVRQKQEQKQEHTHAEHRPVRDSRFEWEFLTLPKHGHKSSWSTKSDADDHSLLEEEYLSLRRKLTRCNKDFDKDKKDKTNSQVVPDSELRAMDFLQSDSIGIDHFQKHINNVRSSSKRFKRSLKFLQPKQKQGRTLKFKAVYEDADILDSSGVRDPVTQTLTSSFDLG